MARRAKQRDWPGPSLKLCLSLLVLARLSAAFLGPLRLPGFGRHGIWGRLWMGPPAGPSLLGGAAPVAPVLRPEEVSFDEEEGTDELFSLMTSPSMGETGKEVPDEHQAAAIVTSARYALLVSGAGTGKTRVLGARMAHLIASKAAKPSQVLILSFSKAAAKSIQARAAALLSSHYSTRGATEQELVLPSAGTFHALAASLLRTHMWGQGHGQLRILSKSEQVATMREVMYSEEFWQGSVGEVKALLRHVSLFKAQGVTSVDPASCLTQEAARAARLFPAYQASLRDQGAMDFDDLILQALDLFRQQPQVLESLRSRYKHILVDEFQDTNAAQYALLQALAFGPSALSAFPSSAPSSSGFDEMSEKQVQEVKRPTLVSAAALGPSVFVAGDDDQSIYSFQGARAGKAFSAFLEDFPGAVAIGLRTSYRLPGHLFVAAKTVIERNEPDRFAKMEEEPREPKGVRLDQMERSTLQRIAVVESWDDVEEAAWVAKRVGEYAVTAAGHRPLDRVAVLVRSSWQLKVLESAFRHRRLPYALAGSASANGFQRKPQQEEGGEEGAGSGDYTPQVSPNVVRCLALLRLLERGNGDGGVGVDWDEEVVVRAAVGDYPEVMAALRQLARTHATGYLEAARLALSHGLPYVSPSSSDGLSYDHGPTLSRSNHTLPFAVSSSLQKLVDGMSPANENSWAKVLLEKGGARVGAKGRARALKTVLKEAGVSVTDPEVAELIAELSGGALRLTGNGPLTADEARVRRRQELEEKGGNPAKVAEGAKGVVTIATMHEAKGREFDLVFLPGWDEGVFPLRSKTTEGISAGDVSLSVQCQIKEERRLAYVALTRARVNAFITFAHRRQLGGQTVLCTPSRFLKELPPGLVRFTFLGAKRLANSMKPTTDADFRKLRPGHVRTRRDELLTLADGPASDKVVEKADDVLEEEEGKGKEKAGAEGEFAAQSEEVEEPVRTAAQLAADAATRREVQGAHRQEAKLQPGRPKAQVEVEAEVEVEAKPSLFGGYFAALQAQRRAALETTAPAASTPTPSETATATATSTAPKRGRPRKAAAAAAEDPLPSSSPIAASKPKAKRSPVLGPSFYSSSTSPSTPKPTPSTKASSWALDLLGNVDVAKADLKPFYLSLLPTLLGPSPENADAGENGPLLGPPSASARKAATSLKIPVSPLPPPAPVAKKGGRKRKEKEGEVQEVKMKRLSSCSPEELGLVAVQRLVGLAEGPSDKEAGKGAKSAVEGAVKSVLHRIMQLYGLASPTAKTPGRKDVATMGQQLTTALQSHTEFRQKGARKAKGKAEEEEEEA